MARISPGLMVFMKHLTQSFLTNDQKLNQYLCIKNQASYFVGNVLSDLVQSIEFPFLHGKKPIYSFFPSFDYFEFDFKLILKIFPDFADIMKGYYLMVIPPGH